MNITEFTQALAVAVDGGSYDLIMAEGYPQIVWALGAEPETLIVKTVEGDVFQIQVSRMDKGQAA